MAERIRLCEVYSADKRCGSGYLVGDRVVLTSGHVVAEAGRAVKVRCGAEGDPLDAVVVWRRYDPHHEEELDAALLEIIDAGWQPFLDTAAVRWGRLVGGRAGVPCEAVGFPDFQKVYDSAGKVLLRDVEQAVGEIAPLTGTKLGLVAMDVTSSTPLAATGAFWAGQSGAPMLSGPHLVGVVKQTSLAGRRLEAVQVAECLRDVGFRRALTALSGRVPDLEPVELEPLAQQAVLPHSPAALLRAEVRAVGFEGREELLAELQDWCRAPGGYSVRALTGPGGQGKTRLAQELGHRMRAEDWAVLQLAALSAEPDDIYQCLDTLDTPLLLIVDYAEARHEQMATVARHLGASPAPARLLMVARALGDWQQRYVQAAPGLDALATGQLLEIPLPALADSVPERAEVFRRALGGLSVGLRALPGYGHVDWTAIGDGLSVPDLSRAGTVLAVHMAALAALLRQGLPQTGTLTGRPEEVLLGHEAGYWRKTAHAAELNSPLVSNRQLAQMVAVATLCAADDEAEARETLARFPGSAGLPAADRAAAASWLHTLYPDRAAYWGTLQPDLLAEYHVADTLDQDHEAFDAVLGASGFGQAAHALTVLSRAAVDRPLVAAITSRLVSEHAAALAPAAALVATVSENPGPLLNGLDTVLGKEGQRTDLLQAIDDAIPPMTTILLGRAEHIEHLLVEHHRARNHAVRRRHKIYGRLTRDSLTVASADLARALRKHATTLSQMGRYEQSVKTFRESIHLLHRLAARHPETFTEHLALALTNEASVWNRAGHPADALASASKAVELQRKLVAAHPGAHDGRLATALIVRSEALQALGMNDAASAGLDEAEQLCRGLAGDEDIVDTVSLAEKLQIAAVMQAEMGDLDPSLAQESAKLWKRLAEQYSTAYEPHLASAQNILVRILLEVGLAERAQAEADEALRLARRVARGVGTYDVLARALMSSGQVLVKRDQYAQSLAPLREAARIVLQVFAADPEYDADQYISEVSNLGFDLAQLERYTEALEIGREAEEIYRTLVAVRPDRYTDRLANERTAVGYRLSKLGRVTEALEAQREAVRLRRDLAGDGTAKRRTELARSLNSIAIRHIAIREHREAADAREEAAGIYRELDLSDSGAYAEQLADVLTDLAVQYTSAGQAILAFERATEAVGLLRPLAAADHQAHDSDLVQALLSLSGSLSFLRRPEEAAEVAAEAAALAGAVLSTDDATDYSTFASLAAEVEMLFIAVVNGRARHGAQDAARLVEKLRPFHAADAEGWRAVFTQALLTYATAQIADEQFSEALTAARETMPLARVLAESDPATFTRFHAVALYTFAQALWRSDEDDEALEAIDGAVDLFRPLAHTGPEVFAPALSDVLAYRGRMHAFHDRLDSASADSAEAAGLLHPLAEHDEALARQLLVTLAQLGRHLARADRNAEAREVLPDALATYDRLDATSREDLAEIAETVRDLIDELDQAA